VVLRVVRNKFLAGLVVLVPIVLTVKALSWLFTTVDGLAGPLAERLFGRPIPGVGFVATLLVVFVTGVLFSRGPLKRLLHAVEEGIDAVPFVGAVYGSIKKVLQGFANPDSPSAFQRFVFARMPGRTAPGFLTGTFMLTDPDGSQETLATVYVPTNHLYVGDIVVLPMADVIDTDLSVEDGVSLILSAGASVPAQVRKTRG
jgi:uncharacterized membrane protein